MACPAAAVGAAVLTTPASSVVDVSVIGSTTVYHNYEHHLQSIPSDSFPEPFPLRPWLQQHANQPATREFVYKKDAQFELQVRTGPHQHDDFHVQDGEEWLYVMDGDARVQVIDGRSVQSVPLPSGSCYLIPGGTPKSLQLDAGATVLVMNRQRKTAHSYPHYNRQHTVAHLTHRNNNAAEPLDQPDQLLWLCSECGGVAHKKEFVCTNYYEQTDALIAEFESSVNSGSVTCTACSAPYKHAAAGASFKPLPASSSAFPTLDASTHGPPYHLLAWIDTHRHLLAPPVMNRMIHSRGTQWKVMIVGGPNERTDYHIDDGEEWFLMIKGDMNLKVVDRQGTQFRDVHIREGESFLLPANVPHSPQRFENTIGLVIERDRFSYELDGLRWYCANPSCRSVLHTFSFKCEDLGTQLKVLIAHWYEDNEESRRMRTCNKCGHVEQKPDSLAKIKQYAH